ncbi:surface lipoprotein assembly modifier [Aliiroseovarius crassostreae]|uniref:surface lipoprotein assembly modifier n=1 Tax=Aliiroseovarius crassostreae TaxID=154981 RepID=UPI003C7C8958
MSLRRAFIVAAGLALSPLCQPGKAVAEIVTLSADQMIVAARQALAQNQPVLAQALMDAYLAAHPDTVEALVLTSRAARDLGQNRSARSSAKQAWRAAQTPSEKFAAAMVAAQAQSSSGNKTAGQFWLRRASNHAQTNAQRNQLHKDFRYVRERNPWRMDLSFGITPSSNVNDGSSEDTITLFGLPFALSPSAKALSGTQGHVSAKLAYRFAERETWRNFIGAQLFHRETWLDRNAQDAAPMVSNADFRYSSAALTFEHQHLIPKWNARLDLHARQGRIWYGGAALANFTGLGAQLHLARPEGRQISLYARYDLQDHIHTALPDVHVGDIGLQYGFQKWGRKWQISTALQQSFSDDLTREYREVRAEVEVDLGQIVNGVDLTMGLGASHRAYDVSRYALDGRHDNTVEARAAVTLTEMGYMGFAPEISLQHRDTSSNISLYTKSETALGLTLSSQF